MLGGQGLSCLVSPYNIIIATTSILAFIAGDSDISNNSNAFNILVGCLAAFGVFWNSCDRMLSYKSRADMHTGARMVCKEMLEKTDFALIRYQSLKDCPGSANPVTANVQAFFDDITTKLEQVQESCTSAVPDAINQAFKEMNSMVTFDLGIQGLDKGAREDVQVLRIANILLNKEITKSRMWPMILPGAAVCDKTREELLAEYKTDKDDLCEVRKEDAKAAAAMHV